MTDNRKIELPEAAGPPIKALYFNGARSPLPGIIVIQTAEGWRPASQCELLRCALGDVEVAEAIGKHFATVFNALAKPDSPHRAPAILQ
jgi:hypothetical protein